MAMRDGVSELTDEVWTINDIRQTKYKFSSDERLINTIMSPHLALFYASHRVPSPTTDQGGARKKRFELYSCRR